MHGAEVGRLQFTGHEGDFINSQSPDEHTYVDYMHARYYSPATGRFERGSVAREYEPARAAELESLRVHAE